MEQEASEKRLVLRIEGQDMSFGTSMPPPGSLLVIHHRRRA
jgi:hypothetical protein